MELGLYSPNHIRSYSFALNGEVGRAISVPGSASGVSLSFQHGNVGDPRTPPRK